MPNVTPLSAGWMLMLDRKFNVLDPPTITIGQLYDCIAKGLIKREEYLQILTNAWEANPQRYTETDFRSWVMSGYLTPEEFNEITGISY